MAERPRLLGPEANLLHLLTWLSPAFPIGAFAWSHGLETAIAEADVVDGDDLLEWVEQLLLAGSGWNDLVLLAEAFRAADARDGARLAAAVELCKAMAGTKERRQEALALGAAFREAAEPWGAGILVPAGAPYSVEVGALAAGKGGQLEDTLVAFAHAFASGLVSVAARLVPLGQSEVVRVIAQLEPTVLTSAARAAVSSIDELGSCSIRSDIAAMRHEVLPTRIFRS